MIIVSFIAKDLNGKHKTWKVNGILHCHILIFLPHSQTFYPGSDLCYQIEVFCYCSSNPIDDGWCVVLGFAAPLHVPLHAPLWAAPSCPCGPPYRHCLYTSTHLHKIMIFPIILLRNSTGPLQYSLLLQSDLLRLPHHNLYACLHTNSFISFVEKKQCTHTQWT